MTNIRNQKSNHQIFESFYKGWHGFASMDEGENFVVFKLPTPKRAAEAVVEAQKRIEEKRLPLVAIRKGELSNTFIIQLVKRPRFNITQNGRVAYCKVSINNQPKS